MKVFTLIMMFLQDIDNFGCRPPDDVKRLPSRISFLLNVDLPWGENRNCSTKPMLKVLFIRLSGCSFFAHQLIYDTITYANHYIYLFLENIRTDTTDQNSYWSLLIIRLVYVSFSQFQLFKHIMYSQTNSQVQWEDPILNLKTVKIVCVTSFNCPTCSLKLSNVVCF